MTSVTKCMMDLFIHRVDVFAEQNPDGSYTPIRTDFTEDEMAEHLAGFGTYGTYVIRPEDQTVRYAVFDLDVLDPAAADALCSIVDSINPGLDSANLLREFSGSKGTHVWCFFDGPVPAAKVRRWLAVDFMPKWVDAASTNGWPTAIEIFPKQDEVPPGGFGNLVKLPLGLHQKAQQWSELQPFQDWPTRVVDVVPLPASEVPERTPTQPARHQRYVSGATGPSTPFPCVDAIMRDGVGQGVRDRAMFHLGLYCYGHGLDQDIAEEVCRRANENFQPPLSEGEVLAKVRSAYRGTHSAASCGADWLVDVCPGPCRTGWHVARTGEGGALARATAGSLVSVEVVGVQSEQGRRRVMVGHPDAQNQPTFVVKS